MQCPNCQKEYSQKSLCPYCKVDAVLYSGTVRLSDKLYNKGLTKLNNADLTQGIELLNRSVSVNKNNVPARNLLGLALFEIGYVGDALKHWVVSQSLVKDNNLASYYIEEARKNGRSLEELNDAVMKYNQALTYINHKSDDLAIIQLKRAVELNPRFIDALNLLALCHLIQNDREKAAAAAERVLAIDIQNTVALNYLNIINPGRAKPESRHTGGRAGAIRKEAARGPKAPVPIYKPVAMQEKKPRAFRFDIILALIIGAACAFAAMYVLLVPALDRQHASQLQIYQNNVTAAENARIADAEAHATAILAMEADVAAKQAIVDATEAQFDLQDRKIQFNNIENVFRDGELYDAVTRLDELDVSGFPRDLIDRAENIRDAAYPQLAVQFRTSGVNAFNANDYYLALAELERALRFMDPDDPALRTAPFLEALATIYVEDEARHAEARVLLEEMRDRFPHHRPRTRDNMFTRLTDLD